ncbi:hypothetical protein FEM48_Zijuj06G0165600 [Ziziphus jujuba var. spinosa]|uniref:GST N-terminal domain-containing protein n=1 Tax=Ziziphus jujuba var. spinosa TaxID=714518 RepID=A0A978VAE0_ZIZJJ|nr:hypothetical protein FEM48_Zijuj06G0165600 [Ziziphus jujuba var. spinosa]
MSLMICSPAYFLASNSQSFSREPKSQASNLPSTLKWSPFSQRFFKTENLVSRRKSRFHVNSAESDADTSKLPTQISRENEAVPTNKGGNPSASLLSFLCPLLKLFSGGDPSRERNYTFEVATSSLSTLARLPWGSRSLSKSISSNEIATLNPPMRIQIFEFGKRVREAITELDLSVEASLKIVSSHVISICIFHSLLVSNVSCIKSQEYSEVYPCPKGSVRHREMVRRFGGKEQYFVLTNIQIAGFHISWTRILVFQCMKVGLGQARLKGLIFCGLGDIVKYLFQQYGQGRKPSVGLLESTILTGWVPTILRAGRGMTLWENARLDPPPKKLELFSYENNPYARIVREALCELELPYILQNVGEGSFRSNILLDITGTKEVPYLIDPNTGTQVGEYKKILSYLFQTYSTATA